MFSFMHLLRSLETYPEDLRHPAEFHGQLPCSTFIPYEFTMTSLCAFASFDIPGMCITSQNMIVNPLGCLSTTCITMECATNEFGICCNNMKP